MTNKLKRWSCPQCRAGVLAPSRPRKNNVKRYCLSCSEKKGVLVERVCPSLDKKRSERKSASIKKAKTKQATIAERYLIESYDIRKAIKPIAKMMTTQIDNILPVNMSRRKNLRNVIVQVWRKERRSSNGHAETFGNRIHVTCGTNLSDALFVLIHEFAHMAIGRDYRDDSIKSHGREFRSVQRSAVKLFNQSNFRLRHQLPEVTIR